MQSVFLIIILLILHTILVCIVSHCAFNRFDYQMHTLTHYISCSMNGQVINVDEKLRRTWFGYLWNFNIHFFVSLSPVRDAVLRFCRYDLIKLDELSDRLSLLIFRIERVLSTDLWMLSTLISQKYSEGFF